MATQTFQGQITTVQGTNTSFALERPTALTTAEIISELGTVTGHTNLTKSAKLVIIDSESASFAIVDGTTFVAIDPSIMSLSLPSTNSVQSGVQNGGPDGMGGTGLAFRTLKQLVIIEVDFNDIGLGGKDLQFSMRGLATGTTSDTVPTAAGDYTETFSAKISDMTGDGTEGGTPFATGSLSASGKADLSL